MRFAWAEAKDVANQCKHEISFSEARSFFERGSDYMELFDAEHFAEADRLIAIGPSDVAMVGIVWSDQGADVIRIISAPRANRRESELFIERAADLR